MRCIPQLCVTADVLNDSVDQRDGGCGLCSSGICLQQASTVPLTHMRFTAQKRRLAADPVLPLDAVRSSCCLSWEGLPFHASGAAHNGRHQDGVGVHIYQLSEAKLPELCRICVESHRRQACERRTCSGSSCGRPDERGAASEVPPLSALRVWVLKPPLRRSGGAVTSSSPAPSFVSTTVPGSGTCSRCGDVPSAAAVQPPPVGRGCCCCCWLA